MTIKDIIKIEAHKELSQYSWYDKSYSPNTADLDDEDILSILSESNTIFEEEECESRHWIDVIRVCKLGDKYFRYGWAKTTGDESPKWKGWEFDISTVEEVTPKEKTVIITTYERV